MSEEFNVELPLRFSDALKAVYLGPIRDPAAERRFVAMRERARAEAAAQEADKKC